MRRRIIVHWKASSFFGWGVYGLNLALEWARDPDVEPICSVPLEPKELSLDPLRRGLLGPFLQASAEFQARLEPHKDSRAASELLMLAAVDDQFRISPAAHGVALSGAPTLAVTFFETAQMSPEAVARAAAFPLVITGSTWNAQVLREHGVENVRIVLQGVDPSHFHAAPRSGLMSDRFLVFSGGKLERRKGQDIVLAAFRKFAARHRDALLVTAWRSPWPELARTLDKSGLASPVIFDERGRPDVRAWAAANGVEPAAMLDLGLVPNALMPPLLREMDVALFPNRAEGGTNLVAMEAMACGVPTILSRNTGHLDLIEPDNCYILSRQSELGEEGAGFGAAAGWGESDVDEAVEALERAYADREEARRIGASGAATLARMSWARTARQMKEIVLGA